MDERWVRGCRVGLGIALIGCVVGCGSRDDWFPMKKGKHWKYQVRSGFETRVEPVSVLRPLAVASAEGFELTGPLGTSRLGWRNGTLYADLSSNAQFIPAVPLLVPGVQHSKEEQRHIDEQKKKLKAGIRIKKDDLIDDKPAATWHGRVVVLGKERAASAVLREVAETIPLGVRNVATIHATLTVKLPNGNIVLESWYQQGVGLVQQEQRTNGTRIVQLQLLGHDE